MPPKKKTQTANNSGLNPNITESMLGSENSGPEWMVDKVLDKRTTENGGTEWLITWKYISVQDGVQDCVQDAEWEPDENLVLDSKMGKIQVIKKQNNTSY